MLRAATALLCCLPVLLAADAPARPESAPDGEPVTVRLRCPPGHEQAARLRLTGRFDSVALGVSFVLELSAAGSLEAVDDAQVELALAVGSCTLNGAEVPQAAGQRALLRARLDEEGRPVPGSLRLQWTAGGAADLVATWCEALFLHLPRDEVRAGEVWDLPVAAPVGAVPLPDGTRFELTGWQRLKETNGLSAVLDAGFSGSVADLPVRLPVTRVRTTLDAALEGDGETRIAGDGTLRLLRLEGRARMDVANPAADDPLPARGSFTVELTLEAPAEDDA